MAKDASPPDLWKCFEILACSADPAGVRKLGLNPFFSTSKEGLLLLGEPVMWGKNAGESGDGERNLGVSLREIGAPFGMRAERVQGILPLEVA